MFHASYVKGGDCWFWTAQQDKDGYGVMRLKGRRRQKAHRFSYELHKGNLTASTIVRHTCDEPSCVNPDHLLTGNALDNKRDSVERERHTRGTGHYKAKLTEDDVRVIRASQESGAALGRRYGVSKENIYAIRNGQIWKHVT